MGSREENTSDQNHKATLLTLSEAEGSKRAAQQNRYAGAA
jgi:hypothetical protein